MWLDSWISILKRPARALNQFPSGSSRSVNTGVPDFDHHTRDTTVWQAAREVCTPPNSSLTFRCPPHQFHPIHQSVPTAACTMKLMGKKLSTTQKLRRHVLTVTASICTLQKKSISYYERSTETLLKQSIHYFNTSIWSLLKNRYRNSHVSKQNLLKHSITCFECKQTEISGTIYSFFLFRIFHDQALMINYENKTNKYYADTRIYYTIDVVSLLHVSAT